MNKSYHRYYSPKMVSWLLAVTILVAPLTGALAQSRIKVPTVKSNVQTDVKLGQQAATEASRQLPLLNDREIEGYVESIGRRLVSAIPSEFQQPAFRYSFQVVNAREINAFALPGGFTYVNRGLIEAARNEGELAGVMAHEISHVALRHGIAQAEKGQKYQAGAVAGQILGAIVGGGIGSVIAQGTQLGITAAFTRFSRDYETQSDILGAQMMARAGYDPRDLANMFRTIEREGGGRGGPEFLSSHPNPGNRYERINQEAALLRVEGDPRQDTAGFNRIQSRLRGMGRAGSMSDVRASGNRSPRDDRSGGGGYSRGSRVESPSSRYRTYTGGNLFRLQVPENWREVPSDGATTFAPEGGYGDVQNQFVFTHGVQVGAARAQSNNLQEATEQYINSLLQGNQYLRQQRGYGRSSIGGRNGLSTVLAGQSDLTGRTEVVSVYTALLRGGDLFYVIAVAPQEDYRNYQGVFSNILRSVEING